MRHVSATEAKQALSRILDAVQREPIVIQKQRRDVAVLLSMRDYERLTAMNVAEFQDYCGRISQRARERGLTDDTLDTLLHDQV
jgi:prevent-host-death family protein